MGKNWEMINIYNNYHPSSLIFFYGDFFGYMLVVQNIRDISNIKHYFLIPNLIIQN